MKTKLALVSGIVGALIILSGWCWYSLAIPDQTLANEGRCSQSVRIQAIDATRHLFGRKTSSEVETDLLKQYAPLQAPAKFACAD